MKTINPILSLASVTLFSLSDDELLIIRHKIDEELRKRRREEQRMIKYPEYNAGFDKTKQIYALDVIEPSPTSLPDPMVFMKAYCDETSIKVKEINGKK